MCKPYGFRARMFSAVREQDAKGIGLWNCSACAHSFRRKTSCP